MKALMDGTGIFELLVELAGISELSQLLASLEDLNQSFKNVMSVIGVFVCIVGLLQCFLGYKLFKIWCAIVGFVFGLLVAFALATSGMFSNTDAAEVISILLFVVLGITGAFLAYRLYLVGLFMYAFTAVFVIGFFIFAIMTDSIMAGLVTGFIAGLIVGILAVIFRRFWIILTTSISGGVSISNGLMMVMQSTELGYLFILPPLLTIAGFMTQYSIDKRDHGGYARPMGSRGSSRIYPSSPDQHGMGPITYECQNCGYAADSKTAPCSNCGGAVRISGIPDNYS